LWFFLLYKLLQFLAEVGANLKNKEKKCMRTNVKIKLKTYGTKKYKKVYISFEKKVGFENQQILIV